MKSSVIQKGFTLVELLIVVIILAILAAIVVPQFTNTTNDANDSALDSNLANLRSVIDLYAQQHRGDFPAANAASLCANAPGTMTSGDPDTQQALLNQLAFYSNANGVVCNVRNDGSADYLLGPYLNKAEIPANPVTGVATVVVVTGGDLQMRAPAANGGWRYDSDSGKFIADDSSTDSSSVAYDLH